MRHVYIAGPYTGGDVVLNVRAAIAAGQRVGESGAVPFVPHLRHFWHHQIPGDYEQWMRLNLAWLAKRDALVRLPGESPGADLEVVEAYRLELPVHYGVDAYLLSEAGPLEPLDDAGRKWLEELERLDNIKGGVTCTSPDRAANR